MTPSPGEGRVAAAASAVDPGATSPSASASASVSDSTRPGRRSLSVAAVTGGLDWSHRSTCSGDRFDHGVARGYVDAYVTQQLDRMREAARQADVVVGPEYFRGSEMFTCQPEQRLALVEPPDGPTALALATISRETGAVLCCAYDMNIDGRVVQTAIVTDPALGVTAIQPKHPRQIPAPVGWPFDTSPRVYDVAAGRVAVTVCSDCTYDPALPLALARQGMELLLLPGCGFAGDMWLAYLRVRARDTQTAVVHADDHRAAVVDSRGGVVGALEVARSVLRARIEIHPRRSSPDAA